MKWFPVAKIFNCPSSGFHDNLAVIIGRMHHVPKRLAIMEYINSRLSISDKVALNQVQSCFRYQYLSKEAWFFGTWTIVVGLANSWGGTGTRYTDRADQQRRDQRKSCRMRDGNLRWKRNGRRRWDRCRWVFLLWYCWNHIVADQWANHGGVPESFLKLTPGSIACVA